MALGIGDRIPALDLKTPGADGMPEGVNTGELLGSGRVVLFAVPGAFTPGCSKVHLPGYVEQAAALAEKGVDKVVCLSVNDAFVMGAWGEAQQAGDIVMLADGNGEFTAAMDLVMDGTGFGLGSRSRRYAMVIEDGVITHLDVEEGGDVTVSSCHSVIEKL